jgi:hypothetical protein
VLKKLFGKSNKVVGILKESGMAEEVNTQDAAIAPAPRRGRPPKKRGPGRPKGSGKKKPGRPKGSGKKGKPGRPKGSGKRGPGRPKAKGKAKAKKKPGRPKGSGRKAAAKGGLSAALQAKRIVKAELKAFKAKLPAYLRRELKKLL